MIAFFLQRLFLEHRSPTSLSILHTILSLNLIRLFFWRGGLCFSFSFLLLPECLGESACLFWVCSIHLYQAILPLGQHNLPLHRQQRTFLHLSCSSSTKCKHTTCFSEKHSIGLVKTTFCVEISYCAILPSSRRKSRLKRTPTIGKARAMRRPWRGLTAWDGRTQGDAAARRRRAIEQQHSCRCSRRRSARSAHPTFLANRSTARWAPFSSTSWPWPWPWL